MNTFIFCFFFSNTSLFSYDTFVEFSGMENQNDNTVLFHIIPTRDSVHYGYVLSDNIYLFNTTTASDSVFLSAGGYNYGCSLTNFISYDKLAFWQNDSLALTADDLHFCSSTNGGFNRQVAHSDSFLMALAFDKIVHGKLYLSQNKDILISTDDGSTFIFYKSVDEDIKDLYKKPESDRLFYCTDHFIYEVTPTDTTVLKNIPTSIDNLHPELFPKFDPRKNYPNPFNTATTIEFSQPQSAFAQVLIYDTAGRLTADLFDGFKPAGQHRLRWNAGNFASGTYFFVLQAGSHIQTRKILLLK